jgi:ABC-type antimicrobial peptide transport system permease subunit
MAFQNANSEDLTVTLAKVKSAYKSVYTDIDDYRVDFIDDTIARFYNREQKVSKLLNWATGLSILISCLGLLGLVIYTTNRRIKEIGVRKVLGASILQINTLLCKEFLVLVAIAFIIAVPIAWYGVYDWLKDFAFKTTISFWVFIVSGLAMIGFALIIISIKTLKAASVNPVNSLRSE